MTTENGRYKTGPIDTRPASTPSSNQHAAALRGATLAFEKSRSNVNANHNQNVALAAATKAGKESRFPSKALSTSHSATHQSEAPPSDKSSLENSEHDSLPEQGFVRRRLDQLSRADTASSLKLPTTHRERSRSPSYIAASIAVSKSTPSSPSHTGDRPTTISKGVTRQKTSQQPRPLSRSSSNVSETISDEVLDTAPIQPTTSLIGMFEQSVQKKTPTKSAPKDSQLSVALLKSPPPEIQSPKPVRVQSRTIKPTLESLTVPKQRTPLGAAPTRVEKLESRAGIQKARVPAGVDEDDASSDDSFVSAPEVRQLPRPVHNRNQSSTSFNAMTVDALANAIVASSLASTRAASASPSKHTLNDPPPVPPTRRPNSGLFHHQHHHLEDSRASSPVKGLRQTLRKPPKHEEDEDSNILKRGRKHIMKKPNKHHEGDRKRWRDSITERERKRYEAVWASNKGLFVSTTNLQQASQPPSNSSTTSLAQAQRSDNPEETVSNVVVRDIWSRSRLGEDVLAEVWDLVDRSRNGRLAKEEFVVGMWLIDQRLKGRKLPIKVSESVWTSVGALGVTVRGNGRKGR